MPRTLSTVASAKTKQRRPAVSFVGDEAPIAKKFAVATFGALVALVGTAAATPDAPVAVAPRGPLVVVTWEYWYETKKRLMSR